MSAKTDVGTLEASGLVGLAAMEPELEYLFRHVLVQDAAYASLLKQERRELHRRVAEALLQLYPERRAELAGVIGMHFEEAGDRVRAVPFLMEAGEQALKRYANREARAFFDRAVAALPKDSPDREIALLRLRAGVRAIKAGWTFSPWTEELIRIRELVAEADRLGDARSMAEAHFWNAFLRRSSGETPATSEELRRSSERLAELGAAAGDPVAQAIPEAMRGAGLVFAGKLREGVEAIEQAIPVIEAAGDPLGTGLLYDVLTLAYARLGDFSAAERNADRADRLAEQGDPIARLDAQITRAVVASERGDLQTAVALASECATLSETLGATSCGIPANYFLGDGRLRLGDPATAKAPFERSMQIAAAEQGSLTGLGMLAQAGLQAAVTQLGEDAPLEAWDQLLEEMRKTTDRLGEATVLARRASALARGGAPDWNAIVADLETAIRLFDESEARPALARALRLYARALERVGRATDAEAARSRSDALATELGLRDREPFA